MSNSTVRFITQMKLRELHRQRLKLRAAYQRLGEEVAAAVRVRAGHAVDVVELQAHVAARLAPFKVPTRVLLLHEPLPRNPAGKVLKRELRDRV